MNAPRKDQYISMTTNMGHALSVLLTRDNHSNISQGDESTFDLLDTGHSPVERYNFRARNVEQNSQPEHGQNSTQSSEQKHRRRRTTSEKNARRRVFMEQLQQQNTAFNIENEHLKQCNYELQNRLTAEEARVSAVENKVCKTQQALEQNEAECNTLSKQIEGLNHEAKWESERKQYYFRKLSQAGATNTSTAISHTPGQHGTVDTTSMNELWNVKKRNCALNKQVEDLQRRLQEQADVIAKVQEDAFKAKDTGSWIIEQDPDIGAELVTLERMVRTASKTFAAATCTDLNLHAENQHETLVAILTHRGIKQLQEPQNQKFAPYLLLSSVISEVVCGELFLRPLYFVPDLLQQNQPHMEINSHNTLEQTMAMLERCK